eukprot:1039788-Rhodomonas_salina.4
MIEPNKFVAQPLFRAVAVRRVGSDLRRSQGARASSGAALSKSGLDLGVTAAALASPTRLLLSYPRKEELNSNGSLHEIGSPSKHMRLRFRTEMMQSLIAGHAGQHRVDAFAAQPAPAHEGVS